MKRLRIIALKTRPALLDLAQKLGQVSACGEFIELADADAVKVLSTPAPIDQSKMSLSDKVQLGLCGGAREAWVAAGQPLRSEAAVAGLKAICSGCELLQPGWTQLKRSEQVVKHPSHPEVGLCRAWSCCHAGRWAATWNCPAGRWPRG